MRARRPPPQDVSDAFKDAVKAAVRRGVLAEDVPHDQAVVELAVGQHVPIIPNICLKWAEGLRPPPG